MLNSNAKLVDSQKIFVVSRNVFHDKVVVEIVVGHHRVYSLFLIFHINVALSAFSWFRWMSKEILTEHGENGPINHPDVVIYNLCDPELDEEQNYKSANADANKVNNVAQYSRLFPVEVAEI